MTHKNPRDVDLRRRQLLASLAAAPAVAGLAACGPSSTAAPSAVALANPAGLPAPADTGIDHVIVVMMENRSFDHMLGWVPGADGRQAGLKFKHKQGDTYETFRLSQDPAYGFQGCDFADPDHGYDGGRIEFAGGACDGFLQTDGTGATAGDKFPVGYYTADDLPFFAGVANEFTICDRYFCGIMSATIPNRIYMHAGQTDRNENTLDTCALPTVWDRLADKGLTGTYYTSDLPMSALWGQKYVGITKTFQNFLADAAAGQLPQVSFIDPAFAFSVGEGPGVSKDDHPHADVRDGQDFLNTVYDAVRQSPQWGRTLLVINYDEWGGFFDHVSPPKAPVSEDEGKNIAPQGNDGRLGFRVPCMFIGPRAKRGFVAHEQFDPNAILNFICWRFGLDGLGVRAATSGNIATALDFDNPPRVEVPPAFNVPRGPFGHPCGASVPVGAPLSSLDPVQRSFLQHSLEMDALRNLALRNGFAIGAGFGS